MNALGVAILLWIAAAATGGVDGPHPAERLDPPAALGVYGLPLAPAALDDCGQAEFYRRQFGLPESFDALVWRESRCRNDVISSTDCCVGWLQLHHVIFTDYRLVDPMAACSATWFNVRGVDPLSKQRQMCAARALFDVAGFQPWALS